MAPQRESDESTDPIRMSDPATRPSISRLEAVPETVEERRRRFTIRAILITVAVVALIIALMVWRTWANAANRAEAVAAYDMSCTAEAAAEAVDLLNSHGELPSLVLVARIEMERAFEELAQVSDKPFDVNGAPSAAKVDAAIAETYRLLIRNERAAAAQMISAVRTSSPAALRARVRAAIALGQFQYAADALAAAPESSDSAVRAELQVFSNAMFSSAGPLPKVGDAHGLTGTLKAALARADANSVGSLAPKLAAVATTPRQALWAQLGSAYYEAYQKGALAKLDQLQALRAQQMPWSDVSTWALAEALSFAEDSKGSLEVLGALPNPVPAWIGPSRLSRAKVVSGLRLGRFADVDKQLPSLGQNPADHFLRGWSSMARGRTQAALRHLEKVGDSDTFYGVFAQLKIADIELAGNNRERAAALLDGIDSVLPRWKAEIVARRAILADARLWNRFSATDGGPKPSENDPYALARYADAAKPAEAAALYAQLLQRVPGMAHANLGLFEIDLARGADAKDWLNKMRFDGPHAPRAAYAQGLFWLREGEGARGAAKLGKLSTRYGMGDWAELRQLRGELAAQGGEYGRATREYALAAKAAENQLDAWVRIMALKSIAHAKLGAKAPAENVLKDIDEKVKEVGKSQVSKETDALWTAARARYAFADKKYIAAQLFAKRALKAEPDLVEAHMVLVDLGEEKGRDNLSALKAAASAPWPSYRAKKLLAEREEE